MSEYVDIAEYYDLDHALTFDIDFYLDYARRCGSLGSPGSPVLELGCGTGRLLLPLAEAGFEVYGVDISGWFIVVVMAPDCERLAEKPGEQYIVWTEFEMPTSNHVVRKNRLVAHDAEQQVRHFELCFEEMDAAGHLVGQLCGSALHSLHLSL